MFAEVKDRPTVAEILLIPHMRTRVKKLFEKMGFDEDCDFINDVEIEEDCDLHMCHNHEVS